MPTALEMSININNAHLSEKKLIVEAANGPTSRKDLPCQRNQIPA
jgi:glutamate dehydrogenase/leucine dehydrogenase